MMRSPVSLWRRVLERFASKRNDGRRRRQRFIKRRHDLESLEQRQLLTGLPPSLAAIAPQTMWSSDVRVVPLSVTDQENDPITFAPPSSSSSAQASIVTEGGTSSLVIRPNAGFDGQFQITVTASDGTSNDSKTVDVTVRQNYAPYMWSASNPVLSTPRDAALGSSAGTKVAELLTNTYDSNAGQGLGIAITAVDASQGTLQYTLDGGEHWQNVGSVSNAQALVLAADGQTRIRFVPQSASVTAVSNFATFRAWDQTGGPSGSKLDATTTGGNTPFSSNSDTLSVQVTPVVGSPALVTGTSVGVTQSTDVAADGQGNMISVWSGNGPGGMGVFFRRYRFDGAVLGEAVRVTDAGTTGLTPKVVASAAGNFWVIWRGTGSSAGVFARQYDASGSALGGTIAVGSYIANYSPLSAALESNGTLTVAWHAYGSSGTTILVHRFSASGQEIGSQFEAAATGYSLTNLAVVAKAGGGFSLWWYEYDSGTGTNVNRFRAFDAAAAATTGIVHLDGLDNIPLQRSSIATISGGGYLASWASTSTNQVMLGRFSDSGAVVGSASVVASVNNAWSSSPTVDLDGQGNYLVAWRDTSGYGNSSGVIRGRLYGASGAAQGSAFTAISGLSSYSYNVGLKVLAAAGQAARYQIAYESMLSYNNRLLRVQRVEGVQSPTTVGLPRVSVARHSSSVSLNLSRYFADRDLALGDLLEYSVDTPDSTGLVSASISQSQLTLSFTDDQVNETGVTLVIRATDQFGLSITANLLVTVTDSGAPPQINLPSNLTIAHGQAASQTFSAFSAEGISYQLDPGAPAGASVSSTGGAFSWTPGADVAAGVYPITVRAVKDGDLRRSTFATFLVTVHDAPTLWHVRLNGQLPRDVTDATNQGLSVASLVGGVTVDPGRPKGIAITATHELHGTLQYSLNGGLSWSDIGTVSDSSALLLSAGSGARVRFRPNDPFVGTIFDAVRFRAWDQSSGEEGARVDTTAAGGTSAFSIATDLVSFTMTPLVGGVIPISLDTSGWNYSPAIGVDASGNFAAAWSSNGQLYVQRYNADGIKQGPLTSVASSGGYSPALAMAPDGRFIVTWLTYDYTTYTQVIKGRLFSADGQGAGSTFTVDSLGVSISSQVVGMDASGGFVIGWQGYQPANYQNVAQARRYTAAGQASGSAFDLVSSGTYASMLRLAMAADGHFAISWSGYDSQYHYAVLARRFAANNQPESDVQVLTALASGSSLGYHALAMAIDGRYAATWSAMDPNGNPAGVYLQRWDRLGVSLGEATLVNSLDPAASVGSLSLALDAQGETVAAWRGSLDGGAGIQARWYDSSGAAGGDPFSVAALEGDGYGGGSGEAVIASAPSPLGRFVVGWNRTTASGSSSDALAQRLQLSEGPQSRGAQAISLPVNAAPVVVNLNDYFSDPDVPYRDLLSFEVVSNDKPQLVAWQKSGAQLTLTITAGMTGIAHLVLRATDRTGQSATTNLAVNVATVPHPPVLGAIGDQTLYGTAVRQFPLSASDPDNDQLTFSTTIVNRLLELDQEYGFYQDSNGFYANLRGQGEKYFRSTIVPTSQVGSWFYILPSGQLYQWTDPTYTSLTGQLIETLPAYVNEDPTMLTNARGLSASVVAVQTINNTPTLVIDPDLGYRGYFDVTVKVSDGALSANRTARFTVRPGQPPSLAAIADQVMTHDTTLQVPVTPSDPDTPLANLGLSATAEDAGYALKTELGLQGADLVGLNFYYNHRGSYEKYLHNGSTYYYILPSGAFYRLHGPPYPAGLEGDLVAQLHPRYYQDVSRIYNASQISATASATSGAAPVVSVTPPANYAGTLRVTATVTDGDTPVNLSFYVQVNNVAPTLAAIPDQTLIGTGTIRTPLSVADPDTAAGQLSYTTQVTSVLYNLDQQYNLSRHATDTGSTWFLNAAGLQLQEKWVYDTNAWPHYLLPDGRFYRYTAGGNGENYLQGTLLATLSSAVYADPNLLVNATQLSPNVASIQTIAGQPTLVVQPPSGYAGLFDVTVTASDGFSSAGRTLRVNAAPSVAILDNGDPGFSATGSWSQWTGSGFSNDIQSAAAGTGNSTADWSLSGLAAGVYRVWATWTTHPNRATNAPYTIFDGNTALSTVAVNQQLAPSGLTDAGTNWFDLGGPFSITSGKLTVRLSDAANQYVMADAIRVERVVDAPVAQLQVNGQTLAPSTGTLAFGQTLTGGTVTKTVTVRNVGTQPLVLTGVISLPSGFTANPSTWAGGISVAPGGSTVVTLAFTPSTTGSFGGTASFATNDPNLPSLSFQVTGTAVNRMIIDNGDPGFSTSGSLVYENYGLGFQGDISYSAAGSGTNVANWTFTNLPTGIYRVSATWPEAPNRATNAPYTVFDGSTVLGTVYVNQELAQTDRTDASAGWKDLDGSFAVSSGTLVVRLSNLANEYVMADAVRIERLADAPIAQLRVNGQTLTPSTGTLAFGQTLTGGAVTKTVTVRNIGTQPLVLSGSINVPSGFTANPSTWPNGTTIAPGGSTDLVLTFAPQAAGSFGGTVSLATNDPDHATLSFLVTGSAASTLIVDDGDPGFSTTGNWYQYTSNNTRYGGDYTYSYNYGDPGIATWSFEGLTPGKYLISATWDYLWGNQNYSPTDAVYTIHSGDYDVGQVHVNQRTLPDDLVNTDGFNWEHLGGQYSLVDGSLQVKLRINSADSYGGMADAIRVQRVGDLDSGSRIAVFAPNAVASASQITVDFQSLSVSSTKRIAVRNLGSNLLDLTHFSQAGLPAHFTATNLSSTHLTTGQTATFDVTFDGQASSSGSISLVSSDQSHSPFSINLVGRAAAIIDDGDAGFSTTGSWNAISRNTAYAGDTLQGYSMPQYNYGGAATWTFANLTPGRYRVSTTWDPSVAGSWASTSVPVVVSGGQFQFAKANINQRTLPQGFTQDGTRWQDLDSEVNLTGNSLTVLLDGAQGDGYGGIVADAVRIERIGDLYTTGHLELRLPDSGDVPAGQVQTFYSAGKELVRTFVIRNAGGQDLALTALTQAQMPAHFRLVSGYGESPLAPGASTSFQIAYDGMASASGTLALASSDSSSPYLLAVAGTPVAYLDDKDSGFTTTGVWSVNYWADWYASGAHSNYQGNQNQSGSDAATWTVTNLVPGRYKLATRWDGQQSPYATNAAGFAVLDGSTSRGTGVLDESHAPTGFDDVGFTWQSLSDEFTINSGTLTVRFSSASEAQIYKYLYADVLRLERLPDPVDIDVRDGGISLVDGVGTVNFGATYLAVPVDRTISILNTGSGTLHLGSITVTGPFSVVSGPSVASLGANQAVDITVRFTPTTYGASAGSLTIASDDPDENPFDISFAASVGHCPPTIDPIGAQSAFTGFELALDAAANDLDTAAENLVFSLDSTATEGAAITTDGHFSWTPSVSQTTGDYTFTVRVTDDSPTPLTDSTTFTVHVSEFNYPPYAVDAPAVRLNENTGLNWLDLFPHFDDPDNSDTELVYEVVAQPDTSLITLSSPISSSSGRLAILVVPNSHGETSLTVRATDPAGDFAETDVTVFVNAAPTSAGLPDRLIYTGAPGTEIDLGPVFGDPDTPMTELQFNVTTDNQSIFSRLEVVDDPAGPYLAIKYQPNVLGMAHVTVRATDPDGATVASNFRIDMVDQAIVDNLDASFAAPSTWSLDSTSGRSGQQLTASGGDGSHPATWTFSNLQPETQGACEVFVTWQAGADRATNATYSIWSGNQALGTVIVNQTHAPSGPTVGGIAWQSLGLFSLAGAELTVSLSDSGDGLVVADAVRLVCSDGAISILPIPDLNFGLSGDSSQSIDLAQFAANWNGTINGLTYALVGNTNSAAVAAALVGSVLTISPLAQAGIASIGISVLNGNGRNITTTVNASVKPPNSVPNLVKPIPDQRGIEDTDFLGSGDAIILLSEVFGDVDKTYGDSLTYSVSANSNSALLSTAVENGMLRLHLNPAHHGSSFVTVRATDRSGLYADDQFHVYVDHTNHAPSITQGFTQINVTPSTSIGQEILPETDLNDYFGDVDADAGDVGDSLKYRAFGDSAIGAEVKDDKLTLSVYSSALALSGDHQVRVTAEDAFGASAFQIITVHFNGTYTNHSPTFVSPFPISPVTYYWNPGASYQETSVNVAGKFTDLDVVNHTGDSLTGLLSTDNAELVDINQSSVTINGNTGLPESVSLRFKSGVTGTANVRVEIKDEAGASVASVFQVQVNPPPAPIISFGWQGSNVLGVKAGEALNAQGTLVTSLPSNQYELSLIGAPSGASIDQAGIFHWTPSHSDVGKVQFLVKSAVKFVESAMPEVSRTISVTVTVSEDAKSPVFVDFPTAITIDEFPLFWDYGQRVPVAAIMPGGEFAQYYHEEILQLDGHAPPSWIGDYWPSGDFSNGFIELPFGQAREMFGGHAVTVRVTAFDQTRSHSTSKNMTVTFNEYPSIPTLDLNGGHFGLPIGGAARSLTTYSIGLYTPNRDIENGGPFHGYPEFQLSASPHQLDWKYGDSAFGIDWGLISPPAIGSTPSTDAFHAKIFDPKDPNAFVNFTIPVSYYVENPNGTRDAAPYALNDFFIVNPDGSVHDATTSNAYHSILQNDGTYWRGIGYDPGPTLQSIPVGNWTGFTLHSDGTIDYSGAASGAYRLRYKVWDGTYFSNEAEVEIVVPEFHVGMYLSGVTKLHSEDVVTSPSPTGPSLPVIIRSGNSDGRHLYPMWTRALAESLNDAAHDPWLTANPYPNMTGQLEVLSGAENVRFWADAQGTQPFTAGPFDISRGEWARLYYVEGVSNGSVQLKFTVSGNSLTSGSATTSFTVSDSLQTVLDSNYDGVIDSTDKNLKSSDPTRSIVVGTNNQDLDHDGILDYADGLNLDHQSGSTDDQVNSSHSGYTPLSVSIPDFLDPATTFITFNYSSSDPLGIRRVESVSPQAGGSSLNFTPPDDVSLRLWRQIGPDGQRDPRDVKMGGDFLTGGRRYLASDLISAGQHSGVFYVEALGAYKGNIDVKIVSIPYFSGAPFSSDYPDPVGHFQQTDRVSITAIDMSVSTNPSAHDFIRLNDGDLDTDGLPDYAETGSGSPGFAPLTIKVTAPAGVAQDFLGHGQIAFNYNGPAEYVNPDFAAVLPEGHLRLWLKDGNQNRTAADYLLPGNWYTLDQLGIAPGPFNSGEVSFTVYAEGLRGSSQIGDQQISVMFKPYISGSPDAPTLVRSRWVTVTGINEHVDSDNTGKVNDTQVEDRYEVASQLPGLNLPVNNQDVDSDGIPNYADGFSDLFSDQGTTEAGEMGDLLPLVLDCPTGIDPQRARIRFFYNGSDPNLMRRTDSPAGLVFTSPPGTLRLWKVDPNGERESLGLEWGGNYITPNYAYRLSDLGFVSSQPITLYLERVAPPDSSGSPLVQVTVDPDGQSGGILGYFADDAAKLSGEASPKVSIFATDKYASEAGDPGCFVISRGEGNTKGSLTVVFQVDNWSYDAVSGPADATPVVDYDASFSWLSLTGKRFGSVTIPEGQFQIPIAIHAAADNQLEWDEKVVIRLLPLFIQIDPSHQQDTVTILDASQASAAYNSHADAGSTGQSTASVGRGVVQVGLQQGEVQLVLPEFVVGMRPDYQGDGRYQFINVDWKLPVLPDAGTLSARLTIADKQGESVAYDTTGLDPTKTYRFGVQADVKDLPSGHYDYYVRFTSKVNGVDVNETVRGGLEIANRSQSAFGAGWWLNGLDQVVPTNGAATDVSKQGGTTQSGFALIRGDATTAFYVPTASATAIYGEDGENSTLFHYDEESPSDWHTGGHRLGPGSQRAEDYRYTDSNDEASYTFSNLHANHVYELVAAWTPGVDRTSDAVYTVSGAKRVDILGDDDAIFHADQRFGPGGRSWHSLGYFTLADSNATSASLTLSKGDSNGDIYLIADGIKLIDHWEFAVPKGTFTSLEMDDGQYVLRDKFGTKESFDQFGLLRESEDRLGRTETYSYSNDDKHRLQTVTDSLGRQTSYGYSGDALEAITDFAGDQTSFEITGRRLMSISLPQSGFGDSYPLKVAFTYNDDGLLESITTLADSSDSADLNRTTEIYYTVHRATDVLDPDSSSWSVRPEVLTGLLPAADSASSTAELVLPDKVQAKYVDGKGSKWTYTTDAFGYLTSRTNPERTEEGVSRHETWKYERDENGLLRKLTEPAGWGGFDFDDGDHGELVTSFDYDERGNLKQTTFSDESVTKTEYGAFSQVAKTTDQMGRVVEYALNSRGLVETMTERGEPNNPRPVTRETKFLYSPFTGAPNSLPGGLVTDLINPIDHGVYVTTHTTYYGPGTDGAGQARDVVQAYGTSLARTTHYEYDHRANIYSSTLVLGPNNSGPTTVYLYDHLDRLVSVTLPDPGVHTGPDGTEVHDHAAPVTSYTYDSLGNKRTLTDPRGFVTEYTYDEMGRPKTVTLPPPGGDANTDQSPAVTEYRYDADGNLDQLREFVAAGTRITKYQYDNRNLVLEKRIYTVDEHESSVAMYVGLPSGLAPPPEAMSGPIIKYRYDAHGNLRFETDPRNITYANGTHVKTEYHYDQFGRLINKVLPTVTTALGQEQTPEFITQYNVDGTVKSTTAPGPNGDVTTTYKYDGLGRRSEIDAPANGRGEVLVTSFKYDLQDHVVRQDIFGQKADGRNLTSAPFLTTTTYYDLHGRPIVVDSPDPMDDKPGLVTYYGYDAAGNQTRSLVVEGNYLPTANYRESGQENSVDFLAGIIGGGAHYQFTVSKYDSLGRVVQSIAPDPDGLHNGLFPSVQFFAYDAAGSVTDTVVNYQEQIIGPIKSLKTSAQYDALHRAWHSLGTPDEHGVRPQSIVAFNIDGTVKEQRQLNVVFGASEPVATWQTTSYAYDALGRQFAVTTPQPNASTAGFTSYQFFDAAGNVVQTASPPTPSAGGDYRYTTVTNVFDFLNRLSSSTTTARATTASTALTTGEATDVTAVTSHSYYTNGLERDRTVPGLANTTFTYDNLGHVLTQSTAGSTTTTSYDVFGRVTSVTDPVGNVTQFRRDDLGRVLQEKQVGLAHASDSKFYRYDAWGNLTQQIDRQAQTIQYAYDNLGHRRSESWFDTQAKYKSNPSAIPENLNTPAVYLATYAYTGLGELLAAKDGSPGASGEVGVVNSDYGFGYNALRQQNSVQETIRTGAGLKTASFDSFYDLLGRQTQRTVSVGGNAWFTTNYSYDAVGRTTDVAQSSAIGAGASLPAARDKHVHYDYVGTALQSISRYDSLGETALAARTTFDYFWSGRLNNTHQYVDGLEKYYESQGYDVNGLQIADWRQYGGPGFDFTKTQTTYDAKGQVASVTLKTIKGDGSNTTTSTTYFAYDANGNRAGSEVDPHNELRSTDTEWLKYDDAGNVVNEWRYEPAATGELHTQVLSDQAGSHAFHNTFSFNFESKSGWQRFGIQEVVFSATTRPKSVTVSFADGSFTTPKTFTTSNIHSLGGNRYVIHFASDDNFNSETAPATRSVRGSLHFSGVGSDDVRILSGKFFVQNLRERLAYQYDHRGRMIKVRIFDSKAPDSLYANKVIHYRYDVFDNLISRTAPELDLSGITEHYFFSENQHSLLEFRQKEGAITPVSQNLWAPGVDQLLAVEDFLPTENGVGNGVGTIWTLADHQGTLQVLVQAKPNGTHEADNLRADPLNTLPSYAEQWTAGVSRELHWSVHTRYTGREYDFDTGLYFNRARVLNPYVQRFMSQDSYGFAAGDSNLYRYAFNSPANGTDPSGHIALIDDIAAVALVGMVIANVGYYYSWHESDQAAKLERQGLTDNRLAAYQAYQTRAQYGAAVGDIGIAIAETAPLAGGVGWGMGAMAGLGTYGLAASRLVGAGLLLKAGADTYDLVRCSPEMDGPTALGKWGSFAAGWMVGGRFGVSGYKSGYSYTTSPTVRLWLATRVVEAGVWISPNRIPEVGPFEPIYGRLNPGEGFPASAAANPVAYGTPFRQLSAKKIAALEAKVADRTITKAEWKHLEWQRRLTDRRQAGIDAFWAQERQALSQGLAGSRHWNDAARQSILSGGQPRGIFSHHKYSVSQYPQLANDPNNILPVTFFEHFQKWHGKNWRNATHGVPLRPDLPDSF